jgi:hypothetical protein
VFAKSAKNLARDPKKDGKEEDFPKVEAKEM